MSTPSTAGQLDHWRTPHPARVAEDQLLSECAITQTRRSGPGGQHRNKVSTAIVIVHRPSGIAAEASERRSQSDNRRVALRRLREHLALRIRSAEPVEAEQLDEDQRLRQTYGGPRLRLSESNWDRPAVLALLLDDLYRCGARTAEAAAQWGTSTSQLIRFLKEIPAAFQQLNDWRRAADQKPLK